MPPFIEPVVVLVAFVPFVNLTGPATCNPPLIPTPPETTNAPVVVDVAAVGACGIPVSTGLLTLALTERSTTTY